MTTPDYMLIDPYALLESCTEVDLSSVLDSWLYIVDRPSYYKLILMHSTDDGHTGYPGDLLSLSSDSLLEVPETNKAYHSPVVEWLVPQWPPHNRAVGMQTEQDVKEEETGTKHFRE